jgi:SMC interacting uncharacterized protein involved in chromosome segregation
VVPAKTMGDLGPWIAAGFGAISTIITAYLGYRATTGGKRVDLTLSERQMVASDAAALRKDMRDWGDAMTKARAECENRLKEVEARVRELERYNDRLHDRLREAGIEEDQP